MTSFLKLHSLGNDFLVVGLEDRPDPARVPDLVRRLCDRHTGPGADGCVFLGEPSGPDGEVEFRIFNADGGEAEISGNGLRCAAAALFYRDRAPAGEILFRTTVGPRRCRFLKRAGNRFETRIGLGAPRLAPRDIPFDDGQPHERLIDYPLTIGGRTFAVTCLSMGNPHCSLFFDDLPSHMGWTQIGKEIESHPFFPNRTNVEFIRVAGRDEIEVLFWERGVGETLSSGTGSAAAAAASIIKGLTDRKVTVRSALGRLLVEWPESGEILQTGVAEAVVEGTYLG